MSRQERAEPSPRRCVWGGWGNTVSGGQLDNASAVAKRAVGDTVRGTRNSRRFIALSLKQRLLLLATIAVLPAFAILWTSQASYRTNRSAEIDNYAAHMADVVMTEVIRGMTGAATMMVAAGRAVLSGAVPAEQCALYFRGLQREFSSVIDMTVGGPDKEVVCHSGPSNTAAMKQQIDLLAAKTIPGIWIGAYQDTTSGPALPIGLALRSDSGAVVGFAVLHAAVQDLQKLVVGASIPASSATLVADGKGTILLSVPAGRVEAGQKVPEGLLAYVFAKQRGVVHAPDEDDQASIIAYRPSAEQFPLAVVFVLPKAEMMAPVDRDAWTTAAIAVLGAVLAFLVAWFIASRFIAEPVRALHGAVSARRAGDRSARTGLQHDSSELGSIASATDALFDELNEREESQARAERQRDLYAREVQHRVKNLLGIIQVVARQSLLRGDPPPELIAFEGRIDAIVRANAKLVGENEPAGTLKALLVEATAPFIGNDPSRIVIEGPDLQLRSKPALALAVAVHELCTNAAKYGALHTLDGWVEIRWQISDGHVFVSWTEQGGPSVKQPTARGFGTLLITRGLEGETRGKVELAYHPTGFSFQLSAPLDALVPNASSFQAT